MSWIDQTILKSDWSSIKQDRPDQSTNQPVYSAWSHRTTTLSFAAEYFGISAGRTSTAMHSVFPTLMKRPTKAHAACSWWRARYAKASDEHVSTKSSAYTSQPTAKSCWQLAVSNARSAKSKTRTKSAGLKDQPWRISTFWLNAGSPSTIHAKSNRNRRCIV